MKSLSATVDGALNKHGSKYFSVTQLLLAITTIVSVASIILETVPSLHRYSSIFTAIEWISVSIFSIEFIARIAISNKKIRYLFSFWGFIDLISILPTFLGLANLTFLKSFRELRILRMLRTLRLAKLARSYSISKEDKKSLEEVNKINLIIYFSTLTSVTIILASALYAVEHAQPAYSTIPLSLIQSSKIIVGGLGQAPAATMAGEVVIIVGRFIGLALFGLLIAVIGNILNQIMFGGASNKRD